MLLYNMVTRSIVQMATKPRGSDHRGMTWGEINYLVLKVQVHHLSFSPSPTPISLDFYH